MSQHQPQPLQPSKDLQVQLLSSSKIFSLPNRKWHPPPKLRLGSLLELAIRLELLVQNWKYRGEKTNFGSHSEEPNLL